MAPRSADEHLSEAVAASRIAEHVDGVTESVLASFRHEALNHIDRLSLRLSLAATALKKNDVPKAQERIAAIDVELYDLSRAIRSLRVIGANPRSSSQPLTEVWEQLVRLLGGHTRQTGVELEIRRDESFDPMVSQPIAFALLTAVLIGLQVGEHTHRRPRPLVVEATRSADDQVSLWVHLSAPVQLNDETALSVKLLRALLLECDGHCSVSGSDQLKDLTMTFPIKETPTR